MVPTEPVGTGLENVVEDTAPQLGGNLDVNGQSLVSTSNGDIVFTPNGTGKINLDGTVQFKRFSTPPAAFDSGMYADDNDKLYFEYHHNFLYIYKTFESILKT